MITDAQAEKSNDFIRDNAKPYAQAKADRVHLQEFRKTRKAILMNDKQGEPQHVREAYAYAHEDYIELLEGLRVAVMKEEEIRWKMKAAELKIEMWKCQVYVNNRVDKSHQ